jgi:PRTRC genetic system ThiF family protein
MARATANAKTTAILNGKLPNVIKLGSYPPVRNVLVVGMGGTGAYIGAHLSRLISVLNKNNRSARRNYYHYQYDNIRLFFADGDEVEDKNLTRQHFINADVGKNKAEVLAERYAAAFGIEIGVVSKDLENIDDFNFLALNGNESSLVIGCVDNNASRKVIREWFLGNVTDSSLRYRDSYATKFWVDSGNEERNGQVVCGYRPANRGFYGARKVKPSTAKRGSSGEFSVPCVTEIYPDILESSDRFNSELSCAERVESAPQNMQTNVTAATLSMNFINKILNGEEIKSHCVEFSIDNNFSTKLNTPENLSVVDNDRLRDWEK